MCYANTAFYNDTLNKCNLTMDKYYLENTWIGNGTESFCNDPKALYEEMTWGNWMFENIDLIDRSAYYYDFQGHESNFEFRDDSIDDYGRSGRCTTFNIPRNIDIWAIEIKILANVTLFMHTPNNYLARDSTKVSASFGEWLQLHLDHELFEMKSSYDNVCGNYDNGRDDCIYKNINNVS